MQQETEQQQQQPILPSLPGVVYATPQQSRGTGSASKVFSIIALCMAGFGLLPLFIELFLLADRSPMALFSLFGGLLFHGVGAIFGVLGMALGNRLLGVAALLANCAIAFLAVILFTLFLI